MHFIKRTFTSTYCLLHRIRMHDFLAFFISRGNDESIISKEVRKCMFYASKRMWAQINSKGSKCQYGKVA